MLSALYTWFSLQNRHASLPTTAISFTFLFLSFFLFLKKSFVFMQNSDSITWSKLLGWFERDLNRIWGSQAAQQKRVHLTVGRLRVWVLTMQAVRRQLVEMTVHKTNKQTKKVSERLCDMCASSASDRVACTHLDPPKVQTTQAFKIIVWKGQQFWYLQSHVGLGRFSATLIMQMYKTHSS